MTADHLLQLIAQILFVLIALVTAANAVRRPRRATIDIALLFGVASLLVAVGWFDEALGITPGRLLSAVSSALIMSLPYLLIRLVDDFTDLPRPLHAVAAAGLIVSAISFFVLATPYPLALTLLYVLYFVGFTAYVATAFIGAARHSTGVTRRRMQAVAAGAFALAATIFLAGVSAAAPGSVALWNVLADASSLACGLAFFIGFAPPRWLRRAWQEPEVRAFLGRAAALPRLPETAVIVRELERGAAGALGVSDAVIGMWDAGGGVLRYTGASGVTETAADQLIGGKAFSAQRPIFSVDAARDDPDHAARYVRSGATTILAAPITAGENRLGVLTVYAPHPPIFADDDLVLLTLLADQAAVILESRALIDEAARVRAREEATRLKDDFLSAAAHDLKTPLTAVVAQAQLLEHRARRNPSAPADLPGIERVVREALRLKRLVLELLDVSRVEQGKLVGARERVDLVEIARECCARAISARHQFMLDAPETLDGEYDGTRIMQLMDNLLENAAKYSPDGGEVLVRLWRDGASACLSVTDRGIGIPAGDIPSLFDRFHRGSNVDDRSFSGLGLGLYICRGIVEQHGGSIWTNSAGVGLGSTFHATLPLGMVSASAGVPVSAPSARTDPAYPHMQVAREW